MPESIARMYQNVPQITLDFGRLCKQPLVFAYKVKKVDADGDGISIGADQLHLNGGSIKDGDGNAAVLAYAALADQAGHQVDGSQETPAGGQRQQQQPPSPANSPPQFVADTTTTLSVDENTATGVNVGSVITATDADGDALTYALTGSDAFAIGASTGQITVAAVLDHETQASHSLTVTVSDGKNAAGEADASVDASIAVTVSIGNVDEAGVVSFDADRPQAGSPLTASLSDRDGGESGVTWTWASSADGTDWTAIAGASGASYTPSADDMGSYLRATAYYTDGHDSGKTANGATGQPVAAASLTDYDSDDDGLISIANQEQLAAITLDLDGDGVSDDEKHGDEYRRVFPDAAAGMGCPEDTGCVGYELDENLTLTGSWSAIGASDGGGASSFSGTFDGNGNTVSGLSIPSGDARYTALFAWLGLDGVIRNVGVIAPDVHNSADGPWVYAAGLVGKNQGAVSGSYVKGGEITASGKQSVGGGLVGQNYGGTVSNSYASSDVSASGSSSYIGGLVGLVGGLEEFGPKVVSGGTVSNSYASGEVRSAGRYNYVGGIVGMIDGGTVSNSHASGEVISTGSPGYVGGLVGRNGYWNRGGAVIDSRASGKVTVAKGDVGGLVGLNHGAIIKSYASGEVKATGGNSDVGGLVGRNIGRTDPIGTISSSYASGKVTTTADGSSTGGLVGRNGGYIEYSYATGRVSSEKSQKVGGLVGLNIKIPKSPDGMVLNSYWDKKTTGVTTSAGSPTSAGKTTEEMKTAKEPSSDIYTGWDTDIWDFSDTASYPTLHKPSTEQQTSQ